MTFHETALAGAYIIEIEKHADARGFFARAWCEKEFGAHGLVDRMVQSSFSYNVRKGTLRGMHYQVAPSREIRLIRCIRGGVFAVVADIRPGSVTYKQHIVSELSEDNHRALYVPEGFALGFQTLRDHTEVFYQMSQVYTPEHARGFRWNDPAFAIDWPEDTRTIIDRDATYPDFDAA